MQLVFLLNEVKFAFQLEKRKKREESWDSKKDFNYQSRIEKLFFD